MHKQGKMNDKSPNWLPPSLNESTDNNKQEQEVEWKIGHKKQKGESPFLLPTFSHFHTLAKLNKLTKNRGNYYK